MISVPNSEPKTVSFTQEVVNKTAEIAKSQITKMALAETAARGKKESADFVLAKATETLKSAEIAYRESISKSAWNKDDIRKAYNNAIAAYREADRRQQAAAEAFTLAKEALAGTRASANGEIAKGGPGHQPPRNKWNGMMNDLIRPRPFPRANQPGNQPATNENENGKNDSVNPSRFIDSSRYPNVRNPQKPKDDGTGRGAKPGHPFHGNQYTGGEPSYNEINYTKSGEIIKREFSDDKRQELAAKGKAMPDGSYPIENENDLHNAIQSYGRAKNPKAVKAHIITQAKALGAEDALPESWKAAPSLSTAVPTNKSIFRKDSSMDYPIDPSMGIPMTSGETDADASAPYDTVLCPNCLGFDGNEGCPHCDGVSYIAIMKQVSTSNPFSTDELLTRPFQKSEAYQNYIMKGGPGSGAQPGHPFNGNQYTGGMRAFSRGEMAGKREGWKQTVKRYQDAHATHMANGRKAVAESKAMSAAGNHRGAADKMEEAAGHFQKAHGALKGIQMIHQRELDRGSMGASQAIADANGQAARDLKAGEYGTAMSEVGRLGGIADAADNAAYGAGA
jgi:hypothetical protein